MVTDEVRIEYSSVMSHNVAGGVVGNMTPILVEAAKFYEINITINSLQTLYTTFSMKRVTIDPERKRNLSRC